MTSRWPPRWFSWRGAGRGGAGRGGRGRGGARGGGGGGAGPGGRAPPGGGGGGLPCRAPRRAAAPAGLCGGCAQERPAWDWACAAAEYEGAARDALHAFKFHGKRALARPLAALLVEQWGPALAAAHLDALVPVPLGRARERDRG